MAAGLNVGSAVSYLRMDTSDYDQGLRVAGESLRAFSDESISSEDRLNHFSSACENVGGKLTTHVTAPLVAVGAVFVKFASDYETSMNKVSTIADDTVVSMADMKKGVLDVSDDMGIAATELSETLYQTISATGDTANALEYVEVASKAAIGGFTDTTTAVDGLTTVLNAYGLEGTEAMMSVSDQMLMAQNFGKTTFGEMSQSIGDVIPIAASLDVSTQNLFASIATLTKNGIQTSKAITGLKAAYSNILKPTKEASDMAEELGINFNAAHLKSVGWAGFLEEIGEATNGDSEAMAKLFGSVEALNTVTVLATTGSEDFAEAIEAMGHAAGSTDEAFDKMKTGTEDSLQSTLNKAKNLAIELGEELLPVANNVISLVDSWVDGFKELDDSTKKNIVSFGLVAASVGPVILGFGKLVATVNAVKGLVTTFNLVTASSTVATTATVGLNASLSALALNPIVIVAGAIALAFAAIAMASKDAKERVMRDIEDYERRVADLTDHANASIDARTQNTISAIDKKYSKEITYHNDMINLYERDYQEAVKTEEKKSSSLSKNLSKRKKALEDNYRSTVKRINDEYGIVADKIKSKTDLVNEYYANEIEKAKGVHSEKLKLYNEELYEKMKLYDEKAAEDIRMIQEEIDAVDGKTAEEDRILQEQRDHERIQKLKDAIAAEEDIERKKELVKELADFREELRREETLKERESYKERLESTIELVRENSETEKQIAQEAHDEKVSIADTALESEIVLLEQKKNDEIKLIQEERKEKLKAEEDKYNATKKYLDKQTESHSGYIEDYKKKLREEIEEKIKAEKEKLEATKERMEDEKKLAEKNAKLDKKYADYYAGLQVKEEKRQEIDDSFEEFKTNRKYLKGYTPGRYASGTTSAKKGANWVGEEGPELRYFSGGEGIMTYEDSIDIVKSMPKSVYEDAGFNDLASQSKDSESKVATNYYITNEVKNDYSFEGANIDSFETADYLVSELDRSNEEAMRGAGYRGSYVST